ncbi:uncharacterized protein Dwil_GK10439 [Drosophila willistoni]|uniref:Uncharacterized protein n=1 Tax=Drosophila willistoni TaxID=7260 RepID=B4NNQ5_DROWI|nr:uncharacterized protein Dwil_GK10439 [Drosophila willistoni]
MNAFNANNGQDKGVDRRGATPRANMKRGDWHVSEEESDDDVPDTVNPAIAASSDEEFDEDVGDSGDSGYITIEESDGGLETADEGEEEFVDEPVVADRFHDEERMWRELDEAVQLMEEEQRERGEPSSEAEEAPWEDHMRYQLVDPEEFLESRSGRNSPEYAPWDDVSEPPAQVWEPARPPTPLRMVDYMSEASESEEEAVAGAGEAEAEASQTSGIGGNVVPGDACWQHMWVCQQVAQLQEADRARQEAVQLAQARERLAALMERERQNQELERQIEYRECPWVWPRPTLNRQMSAPTGPREISRPAVARQESCPLPEGHERYEEVQPEEWPEAVAAIDKGVDRRGATPRANMKRGDWHVSEEESDDDVPDTVNPAIAASSDEEFDEDVGDSGDSGYITIEESDGGLETADEARRSLSTSC